MASKRILKELKDLQKDPPTSCSAASLDSTAQTGNTNGGDWQEEIYQKIKAMKDMYLQKLTEIYEKIAAKLHQQPKSQQAKNLQLEKLKAFKIMVERFITFLQVSKSNIQPGYKEKLGSYEKQIISLLGSSRPRKPVSSLHQGQALPPPHMQGNQIPLQLQSGGTISTSSQGLAMASKRILKELKDLQKDPPTSCSAASLDSTAQTGNANGGDWQEEIYQKIKAVKDMYLLKLTEIDEKIAAKLHQQPKSQQAKNLQLEKLKAFKIMVERFITFLQVSKSNIQPGYKEKLGSYEKQIISLLGSSRPRKPVSSLHQGQALPPPHMQG